MSRKNENETMIERLSTMTFGETPEEQKLFLLDNISAILMDISKSLAVIADDKEPDNKETDSFDTLIYYTTRCTSCGKVAPIGDYCIWCGKKDTCFEGDDKL